MSVFWAQMTSDVVIDIIDKAITVVLAYIIIRLIPERLKKGLWLTGWKQAPLSEEAEKEARKGSTKSFSLRGKIIAIISVIMICIALATTFISYLFFQTFAMKQYTYSFESAAHLAAGLIDPEKVDDFVEKGTADPEYLKTGRQLDSIRQGNPDIEYIYVYKFEGDKVRVVFDLDTSEVKGQAPGTLIELEEYLQPYKEDFLKGEEIETLMDDTNYGRLLTVFEPIYDSTGNCVCYAGGGYTGRGYQKRHPQFHDQSIFFVHRIIYIYTGTLHLTDRLPYYLSHCRNDRQCPQVCLRQ
ncbi:MAG: hypothetical protein K6E19_09295 [Lachnospiraceae bacterium]|nr:hypothetical protein [Lachnospiraceae bacterium]